MRLAIFSDIHDNLWNLAAAISAIAESDVLLCCGDLCSPFVIDELAKFHRDIHIVFGNNDADLYRITAKARSHVNCHLHGEFFHNDFEGKRVAMNHFDYLARPLAKSGDYDLVCFGHNHEFEISDAGACTLINPGPLMGAKFSSGRWEDVTPTFVIYDTASNTVTAFAVDPRTKNVSKYRR